MPDQKARNNKALLANPILFALTPEQLASERERLVHHANEAQKALFQAIEDLDALDRVWVRVLGQAPFEGGDKIVLRHDHSGLRSDRRRVKEAIPYAIEKIQGDFTVRDVSRALQEELPGSYDLGAFRSMISTTLKRMAEEGHLALMSQGKGRAPNIYRRANELSDLPW